MQNSILVMFANIETQLYVNLMTLLSLNLKISQVILVLFVNIRASFT